MRYFWNDKEVSEEEYRALDDRWKHYVLELELREKNPKSSEPPEKKSSRKNSKNLKK